MNLDQIETKCFILALFIRDDGERFLLGSRVYEFVDSQLHFVANSYQNDIVEVQGNDGVMLAGQVRRGTSQPFDGYIGDQTVDRTTIEQYRRDFMKFFRKNHYYKVVYVFPDGSAVQRRNGFIVEAPEVKELYQLFPKYHISMNFEDINYYVYEEDSDGEEIYGESATLKIATSATGGLIWEEGTESEISGEGSQFTLQDTIDGNVLDSVQLKGDTYQQTYSGKNRVYPQDITSTTAGGVTFSVSDGIVTLNGSSTGVTKISDILYNLTGMAGKPAFSVIPISGSWTGGNIGVRFYAGSTQTFVQQMQYDGTYFNNNTLSDSQIQSITSGQLFFGSRNVFSDFKFRVMLTQSTSIETDYEPYTGGIPAPNPDYPQTVNTVTGRQVVTITDGDSQSQSYDVDLRGMNLWNSSTFEPYWISNTGELNEDTNNALFDYIQVSANTDYTASFSGAETLQISYAFYDSSKTFLSRDPNHTFTTSDTITTPANCAYVRIWVHRGSAWTQALINSYDFQFELGSTASTYVAYNPIELCKIGTYQDYIYKSGDDWYIHKAIEKTILGQNEVESDWYIVGSTQKVFVKRTRMGSYSTSVRYIISDMYSGVARNDIGSNTICLSDDGDIRFDTLNTYTLNNFLAFIAINNVTAYYVLATATDTQITNADLIAQLEALLGATTYDGQTVFTVTSANQLAILDVTVIARTGGGVVWDNYGAEWEEGTGGGPTMVNVDSIDNVYPVLTLTGPAVNPQISVLTTNTTLSYSGTVTSSQELKIDMFNKTATLNGASVVGNVSGDWVYLKPGVNRITYTTNNADAPDSTIWWQEIVG